MPLRRDVQLQGGVALAWCSVPAPVRGHRSINARHYRDALGNDAAAFAQNPNLPKPMHG
jgi:hypothetical protein